LDRRQVGGESGTAAAAVLQIDGDGAEGFAGTAAELAGIDSGDGEGGVVWKLGTLHVLIQKLRWADRLRSGWMDAGLETICAGTTSGITA